MSEETKNPLIESFLKLNERLMAGQSDVDAKTNVLNKKVNQSFPYSSTASVQSAPSVQSSPPPAAPSSVQPSTSAFKANMGQPSQGSTAGSSYQPRTFDQKVSDVQKTYSVAPVGTKTSNLRVGSSGGQVSYVQKQLGVTADEKFGNKTREAVMDFQRRNKLKVDGIVGDQTLSALKRAEAMGKLQMADKEGSAAKERANFSGPPSGLAAAPIKPAATTFSGGRTEFSGNAGDIKPVPVERSTNLPTLSRVAKNASGEIDPNAVKRAAEELKRRQEIQKVKESTEMSNKLIEAFMKLHSTNTPNLFEAAKKAKKLDPVGKEDEDIDNDGDKDKTDSYLHNRRNKIAAAMKEGVMQKMPKPEPVSTYEKNMMMKPKEPPTSEIEKHMMGTPAKPTKKLGEESEAELEHIAAVLEAIGPTPDEYSPSAFGSTGSRSGSLSDTVSEEEKKAYTGKKRGRKPGVKIGSYKRKGGEEGEATTNVSVPHVFHQIRTTKPSDGHYTLQHDMGKDKKGNPIVKSAKVPVTAANEFHKAYLGAEKPRDKEALTDKFVEKHFNVSKPKATGITLPSMPAKRS